MLNKKFKSPFIGAIAGLGSGLIGVYVVWQISKYIFDKPPQSYLESIWLVVLGVLLIIISLLLNREKNR